MDKMKKTVDKSPTVVYTKNIKKARPRTVMPNSILLLKNNAIAFEGRRYFLMEVTKSNKRIIKEIMYSKSMSTTSNPD